MRRNFSGEMMNPEFYEYRDQVNSIINQYISDRLAVIGNFVFTYVVLSKSKPTNFIMTSNAPHWYEPYRLERRQLTDPVIIRALADNDFYWDKDTLETSWGDIRIFDDASEYNILHGHTLVIHDRMNNAAMLTLIRKEGTVEEFKRVVTEHKKMLWEVLEQCHAMNSQLRGVSPAVVRQPDRALVYSNGAVMPLGAGDIVGSEALITQLLEKKGYKVSDTE